MKIYIAAKIHRREELQALAHKLVARGHGVPSRWLWEEGTGEKAPVVCAIHDIEDIDNADTVIFIGEPRGSKNTGGGRWFELGYAYAMGDKILIALLNKESVAEHDFLTDGHESVFTTLPSIITFYSEEDLLKYIESS